MRSATSGSRLLVDDRGARVATRFAKDHQQAIDRLVVMDNVPTRVVLQSLSGEMLRWYWFFYFQQVPDLPEALITGREDVYITHFLREWTYHPEALSDEDIAVYARAYREPGAMRGALSDYRAAPEDFAQDQADVHQVIQCPTLALWGANHEGVAGMFNMEEVWHSMGHDVRCVAIDRCGHLPQEEQPQVVNDELLAFLDGWKG